MGRRPKEKPGDGLDFSSNTSYKKYSGVYTNYAIYIDEHMKDIAVPYSNPEVENKVFEYIYGICYILACKAHYFSNWNDYDDFARYTATEFYNTFRNKESNQGIEKRGKVVEPIKSSLNFIKKVLYAYKVEYIKRYFVDIYKSEWENEDSPRKQLEDKKQAAKSVYFKSDVRENYSYKVKEAVEETICNIPFYLKEILNNSQYKNNELLKNRLYKSVMLSFLNSITFRYFNTKEIPDKDFNQTMKKYSKESNNCIILWHLSDEMKGQVEIIISRLKDKLSSEICSDVNEYSLSEDNLNDILETAYSTYDLDQSEY